MADALVSTVLEQLQTFVLDKIKEEVRLLTGVEEEVEKLASTLEIIKDGLADADQRQMVEPKVSDWLWKLKDVSYDIDDLLDQWITSMKQNTSVGGEGSVPSNPDKGRKKVCFSDLLNCLCFRPNIPIVQRHQMAVKIEDLNKRLDAITLERKKFQFKASESNQQFAPRQEETGFAIDEREVKGRDQEKVAIVHKLLSGSSDAPNPQIISIVGMGGLGKTTLAKLVYNDKAVEAHFDKRMWVWVSRSFDATNIAKATYESLEEEATNLTQLSAVMKPVQRSINGKRFLLVLDDVWEEQAEKWEKLKDFLACGLPGSKILLTTRNDEVAITMGCDMSDTLHPETLSEDECWSIFSQIAFSGKADAQPEYLKDIGRKIVKKCQGLPLAAKTLGSLLRSNVSEEKWESVLYSKLWDQLDAKKKLLAPIWLSYSELPQPWRQCFSYCAVFPKGFRIQKHKLIEAWMAQGYLRESSGISMEDVGEEYFKKLAGRSLFQDFEKDEGGGSIIACKMHDMVHDVAQFTSKNECFIMEGSEDPKQDSFYSQLRHTTIILTDGTLHHRYLNCLTKLHSVYFQSKNSSSIKFAQLVVLFSKWSSLRSLNLRNCGIAEIPGEIGEMIHLRWLDLSFNYALQKLPESICKLLNLQSLDVTECSDSMTLPHGIGKLADLRHLHNSLCKYARPHPKSIGLLAGLKTLKWFYVGNDTIEAATLGDLRNLNQLKGKLCIKWLKRISEVEEGKQAQLNQKNISDLTLYFPEGEEERRIHHDADLVDALEPSPKLRSLTIKRHQGKSVFPKWLLSLTRLRKLELVNCKNCKRLPPMGKLPGLEHLVLWHMTGVKALSSEFLGIEMETDMDYVLFPKLTMLELVSLYQLEDWNDGDQGTGKVTIMPLIRLLKITSCQHLLSLPDYILQNATLKEISSVNCPSLRKRYPKEEWPKFTYSD